MIKSLIIVESPAKARTITKYLGRGYTVMASVGHVKDLPTSKLGVDLEHDFKPQYVTIKGKAKILADIKKKAEETLGRILKGLQFLFTHSAQAP